MSEIKLINDNHFKMQTSDPRYVFACWKCGCLDLTRIDGRGDTINADALCPEELACGDMIGGYSERYTQVNFVCSECCKIYGRGNTKIGDYYCTPIKNGTFDSKSARESAMRNLEFDNFNNLYTVYDEFEYLRLRGRLHNVR